LGESQGDATFLREALAPTAGGESLPSRFQTELGLFNWLRAADSPRPADEGRLQQTGLDLAKYDAVCLVDPPPLSSAAWQLLRDYVESGGGLGIFLGRRARRDEMNAAAAQQLLPAQLRWQSREETYLRPVAVEHPALAALQGLVDIAPWSEFPVFKYWELEAGAEDAIVVATYANGKPALVERIVGAGRVLLMTTSLSDPAHDDPWNLLPTGPEPWPFLVLAGGIADYLTNTRDERLNFLAGQTVVLRLAPEEEVVSYVLQIPGGAAVRSTTSGGAAGQRDLTIASTESLGNYRVQAGGRQGRLDRGFSINCDTLVSQLERTTAERIAAALGKDRVRAARTREEIEVRVDQGRIGRELFPALILAVALVLAAEQWLANRFYQTEPIATKGEPGRESSARSGALTVDS
jgi:hypothetical protein